MRLPDDPARPLSGELTFLDNAVQDATGTVRLRATVDNRERRLWPGRFVKVRLLLRTLPGAVLVPAAAPQVSAQGAFVYVVKQDSTAELRPVKTGQRHGDLVIVEQGLTAGERVVVAGQMGVAPGGKLNVDGAVATPLRSARSARSARPEAPADGAAAAHGSGRPGGAPAKARQPGVTQQTGVKS